MPNLGVVVNRASDRIRAGILSGAYPPGSRLVERSLAASLEVSRVPVREALRVLVAEGLAVERPTGGVAVRHYTAAEFEELIEVNATVERLLIRRLATAATSPAVIAGLASVRGVLDETQAALDAGSTEEAIGGNARFHEVLVASAPPSISREVLTGLRSRIRFLMRMHAEPAPIHAEHLALYAAIAAGDVATADELAEAHVLTTRAAAGVSDPV